MSSFDSLSVASNGDALRRVLVIEETNLVKTSCRGQIIVPRLFLRRLAGNRGNSLTPLDDSIDDHVIALHIIFPSVCQFYCAEHLECNPHYTVQDGTELSSLVRLAISKGISVKYYDGDKDHLESRCVRVLNNVHLHSEHFRVQNLPWEKVLYAMQSSNSFDDRRGSFTSHVGFSATRGQGWHNPYPELDDHADGEFGLCKPGITSSMTGTLLSAMGPSLALCGRLEKQCWEASSVNPNNSRQNEFSYTLQKYLGSSEDVVFEAGTFALLQGNAQNLAVHTDILNDSTVGYEKTGVLSLCVVDSSGIGSRITIIGYNRRCCREFMVRMETAILNKQKATTVCTVLNNLHLRQQRNLRVIECAACLWLTFHNEISLSPAIANNQYTEVELTMARSIVRSVTTRGLSATQESRPQIASVKSLVTRLYHSRQQLIVDIDCVCRALTYLIYAHSKNHKLDGVGVIEGIRSQEQFKSCFGSYYATMNVMTSPAGLNTWVDVYGEYTFNKLFSVLNPTVFDERLRKFCSEISSNVLLEPEEIVQKLLRNKVFILGGRLFQMLTVVLLKEVGLVTRDERFNTYLPRQFTKTSGSVKVLQRHAGMADPITCREYIKGFAKQIGISAVTYENVLCKFHVGYYRVRGNAHD